MRSKAIASFVPKIRWSNFLLLTISGFVNAFGVTAFLAPVKLYDSGISGTSMLLAQLTPEEFSLSVFLLLLNVPLFLYGLKRQGALFTIYSLYAVGIYSLGAWLITAVLPIDVSVMSPLAEDDLLLCAIFGGLISGAGSGLTIRFGGAIEGMEVMAVIFAKKLGMTIGTFVMCYNVILYIICGILMQSWILPLYSIITYVVASKTVDFIVEGLDRAKAAMIITDKPDEIAAVLMELFSCGLTKIPAKGGYSDADKTILYIIVNHFQIGQMRQIVHTIDPSAYVTISEVADVVRGVQMK